MRRSPRPTLGGDDLIAIDPADWPKLRVVLEVFFRVGEDEGLEEAAHWLTRRDIRWFWATGAELAPTEAPTRAGATTMTCLRRAHVLHIAVLPVNEQLRGLHRRADAAQMIKGLRQFVVPVEDVPAELADPAAIRLLDRAEEPGH